MIDPFAARKKLARVIAEVFDAAHSGSPMGARRTFALTTVQREWSIDLVAALAATIGVDDAQRIARAIARGELKSRVDALKTAELTQMSLRLAEVARVVSAAEYVLSGPLESQQERARTLVWVKARFLGAAHIADPLELVRTIAQSGLAEGSDRAMEHALRTIARSLGYDVHRTRPADARLARPGYRTAAPDGRAVSMLGFVHGVREHAIHGALGVRPAAQLRAIDALAASPIAPVGHAD